jgi:glycosyltransferase involved in cell wall biosynthesis
MIIWLIASGEPLPIGSNNNRLHRMGLLANELIRKGNEVVWWTSTVDHFSKKHIFKGNHTYNVNDKYSIELLHSTLYYKNISIKRVINHISISLKFWQVSKRRAKPAIIVSAFPTIEFCYAAIKYGEKNRVPVIVDARDMWPDILLHVVPQKFRIIGKMFLAPYFFLTKKIFRDATGIFGITSGFLEWALVYAGRNICDNDKVFPLAYPLIVYPSIELDKSKTKWNSLGITERKFVLTFIGAIAENKIDFDSVLNSAKEIEQMYNNKVLFVFCGMGDDLISLKEKSKNVTNIIFPGWINGPEIFSLLRISAIGLAPYRSRFDYVVSVPNKPIEYFSFGLPILSSLQGELKKMIEKEKVGYHYANSEELVNCIIKLKENKSVYDDFSNNSLRLYHEKYNAELVYKNYADSIISIACKNHQE